MDIWINNAVPIRPDVSSFIFYFGFDESLCVNVPEIQLMCEGGFLPAVPRD